MSVVEQPWPAHEQPPPLPSRPSAPRAAELPSAPAPPAGSGPSDPSAGSSPPEDLGERPLVDRVIDVLKTCFDPEIPLNIYDLSLIYGVEADAEGNVRIQMTLTSPSCPVAGSLPGEVQQKVAAAPGVRSAQVDLVWDPPWDLSRLSEAARLTLGIS